MTGRGIFLLLVLVGVACLAGGCATETYAPENAPEYIVLRNETLFFKYGPQQPGPADELLKAGDRVRMLRKEFGYSLVQLADTRTGYVANEDLALVPPRPVEREEAVEAEPGQRRGGRSRPYRGPIVDDAPLPTPDLSEPPVDAPPQNDAPANGGEDRAD